MSDCARGTHAGRMPIRSDLRHSPDGPRARANGAFALIVLTGGSCKPGSPRMSKVQSFLRRGRTQHPGLDEGTHDLFGTSFSS